MKSHIDWNEIVPRLKKPLRDTLFLEAVLILGAEAVTNGGGNSSSTTKSKTTLRSWTDHTDGHNLAREGRVYRINPNTRVNFRVGTGISKIWTEILSSKAETLPFKKLAELAKAYNMRHSDAIWTLWNRGAIDVVKGK